jgi:hypothetical protein
MDITLRLDAEVERRLREAAARNGLPVEEHIARLAERSVSSAPPAPTVPPEDWESAFRAWVASHPTLPFVADDGRESIYAGRGE